ncbi:MAG: nucleotidyl transferase AbiEii/AbiGii toxin family protein [Patescibacteria group bacterium]|nr:nucleotidyl transferase AbiEii/AbiGii toxin family protein [Patescibacteria group bacterium]MCL5432216.1 nucleotidyl transferase AbiEii/AbiGii toxin family protein [Patescibacteria group bacterium]
MGHKDSEVYERRNPFENEEILKKLAHITDIAIKAGIPVEQIVHVGGIAPMIHTCIATGSARYAINWRGTRDLDFALTINNGPQRLADALEGAGVQVTNRRPSKSIPHKHAVEIELTTGKGLFPSGRILEIDVYGGDSKGRARINDRIAHPYPGKFIRDQAITHTCWGHQFTVPSLIDTLTLKMDVAKETDRPKDTIDISSLIFSAEQSGVAPGDLIKALTEAYSTHGIPHPTWTLQVAPTLRAIIDKTPNLRRFDFAPVASRGYISKIAESIK